MTKLFIAPTSKIILDCVINLHNIGYPVGLIASRRQVDFNGGYIGFTTKEFINFVRSKSTTIKICRDHAGPNQGTISDDGLESLSDDSKLFDVIHIDPWKNATSINSGIDQTNLLIEHCIKINPECSFEIGTEQHIYQYSAKELDTILSNVNMSNVKYAVIQCGTSLENNSNTGIFNIQNLKNMLDVCKQHFVLSKEHNSDFVPTKLTKQKFNLGVSAINIAPELSAIQAKIIIKALSIKEYEHVFETCFLSNKWQKWFAPSFDAKQNKDAVIIASMHYIRELDYLITPELSSTIYNAVKSKIIEKF